MKKVIVGILAGLGVIFLIQIVVVAYVIIMDPYNLKPLFNPTASEMGELKTESEDFVLPDEPMTTAGNQGFTLTAEQRQAVISLGVPEASVPTTVSYEMEQCFIGVLGEARVEEIKAGAMPGGLEFIRAQACI